MQTKQIVTVQDIINLENNMKKMYCRLEEKLLTTSVESNTKYLRSKQVQQMLSISANRLRDMRKNSQIPYTFLGSTYYYSEEDILEVLKSNTINK